MGFGALGSVCSTSILSPGRSANTGHASGLQDQPFDVLCALIERPGELVTREDLRARLWPNDTFVDFDQSVNKAVNKLREALGDSASHPIYIETLARRGYRFLVPVEVEQPGVTAVEAASRPEPELRPSRQRNRTPVWLAISGMVLAVAIGTGLWPIDVPQVVSVVQLTHDGVSKGLLHSDGIRVMYGDGNDVWSIPVAGGEHRKLPLPFVSNRPAGVYMCGYAPLRQQALFWTRTTGPAEMWLMGPDGDAPRRIGELDGGDARLALSPDAGRLAISLPDGIYIQSIATGQRAKIRAMTWKELSFLWWHPSGDSLGFLDFPDDNTKTRAWQMSVDGGHLRRIVPEREQVQGPGSWSPDGRRFYYLEEGEVFVRAEAGMLGWLRKSAVTRLTTSGQFSRGPFDQWPAVDPVNPKQLYVAGWVRRAATVRYDRKARQWVPFLPGFSGDQIDRSPDGQWLTYFKYPAAELHKCRVDGSGDLVLARGVVLFNPKWSPDGKRIAFAGRRWGANENLKLWLVSAGGGDAAPYRSDIDVGFDAVWSKDGKRILFAQGGKRPGAVPKGEGRIRILNLETGTIETVPKSGHLFSPRWAPDEKRLLALDIESAHLHLFDLVRRDWRQLTDVSSAYPTWSPDGKWVYAFDEPNVIFRVEVASGRCEEIVRPDFRTVIWRPWVGWTDDWEPLMLRDLGSSQIYRIDLDR